MRLRVAHPLLAAAACPSSAAAAPAALPTPCRLCSVRAATFGGGAAGIPPLSPPSVAVASAPSAPLHCPTTLRELCGDAWYSCGSELWLQSDRFSTDPDTPIVWISSSKREALLKEMSRRSHHPQGKVARIQVSGLGGCGKSHTMVEFVRRQRAAGHVVAYVPTMEACVQHAFLPLHLALRHACEVAAAAQTKMGASSNTVYFDGKLNPPPDQADFSDAVLTSTLLLVKTVRKAAAERGQRLIIVLDQDNRLWRALAMAQKGGDSGKVTKLYRVNSFIEECMPDALFACASANNEGWERRGWPSLQLDPDAFDATADVELMLGRSGLGSAMLKAVKKVTGGNPLELRKLGEVLGAGPLNDFDAKVSLFDVERVDAVRFMFTTWFLTIDQNFAIDAAQFVERAEQKQPCGASSIYDKRLMWIGHDRVPQFLSPVVARGIVAGYKDLVVRGKITVDFPPFSAGLRYEALVLSRSSCILRSNHRIGHCLSVPLPENELPNLYANPDGHFTKGVLKSYVVSLQFQNERDIDTVIVTRDRDNNLCVIYVQVCVTSSHVDSYKSFLHGPFIHKWTQMRASVPRHVNCYEAYLWVTPTERGAPLTMRTRAGNTFNTFNVAFQNIHQHDEWRRAQVFTAVIPVTNANGRSEFRSPFSKSVRSSHWKCRLPEYHMSMPERLIVK